MAYCEKLVALGRHGIVVVRTDALNMDMIKRMKDHLRSRNVRTMSVEWTRVMEVLGLWLVIVNVQYKQQNLRGTSEKVCLDVCLDDYNLFWDQVTNIKT